MADEEPAVHERTLFIMTTLEVDIIGDRITEKLFAR